MKWIQLASLSLIVFTLSAHALAAGSKQPSTTTSEKKEVQSAAQSPPGSPAPAYHNTRFEEDWSQWLNDRSQHLWPSVKRVGLGSSDTAFFSLGGQVRFRAESFHSFGFGGPGVRDDTFGLFRLRLHGNLVLSPNFRVFVEGKSSLATGRQLPGGNRTLDTDSIDLQNAFADVTFSTGTSSSFTLRIGRRELQYGRQRLASPLDWSNTRPRTFDGVAGILKVAGWQVDGFWSKHVRVRKYNFNRLNPTTQFFGVYGTGSAGRHKLDLYWLGLDRKSAAFGGVTGRDQRHTFGGRLAGSAGGQLDFDVEAAFQGGDHAGRSVRAMMLGSQLGWRPSGAPLRLRIFSGFDFGSGDSDPTDNKVGTFNQLFPLGHAYLGHIDTIGRQNIVDWSQGVSLSPVNRFSLTVASHLFWRARSADALYNAGGGIVRAGAEGTSKRVGNELNIDASVGINRHFSSAFGYGHFFAGSFIEETGPDDDIDFWYLGLQFTF